MSTTVNHKHQPLTTSSAKITAWQANSEINTYRRNTSNGDNVLCQGSHWERPDEIHATSGYQVDDRQYIDVFDA